MVLGKASPSGITPDVSAAPCQLRLEQLLPKGAAYLIGEHDRAILEFHWATAASVYVGNVISTFSFSVKVRDH